MLHVDVCGTRISYLCVYMYIINVPHMLYNILPGIHHVSCMFYILSCILCSLYSIYITVYLYSIVCNVLHHAVDGRNPALVGIVKRL